MNNLYAINNQSELRHN